MLALLVVVLFLLLYHTRYDIILSSKTSFAGDRHNMPVTLTFDVLTLKVVSESHVTWTTSGPILVFLGLSIIDLGLIYATDRQTDKQTSDKSIA